MTHLTYWDVADGEQADARVAIHRPLLCLTVGLTAVVHEARIVSLWASIDDPVLGGWRNSPIEYFVLILTKTQICGSGCICGIDYCNVTAACDATFPMQYCSVALAPTGNGAAGENAAPWNPEEQLRIWFLGTNLVDGEHVKVGDVVLLGVLDPRPALLLVNQLADVLVHKLTLLKKCHVRKPNSEKQSCKGPFWHTWQSLIHNTSAAD